MDSYDIVKTLQNQSFSYGDTEEKIGFIFDHYYEAMAIYRCIAKHQTMIDEKRNEAHEQLQMMRGKEERGETAQDPDFDPEEWQAKKDKLAYLREKDYDIMYRGAPLPYDKLTHLIMRNMWLFKRMEKIDRVVRNQVGRASKIGVKTILWPMKKMMLITARNTESLQAESFLRKTVIKVEAVPDMIEEKIKNA